MIEVVDQAQTLKRIVKGNMDLRVLAVSSGKGGVGKTNVVANLAYSLCKKGKRVLVFDGDVGLANIHILLGLSPEFNLEHVLKGEQSVDDVIVEGPGGIKIFPASEGVEELTHLSHDARLLILEQFDQISADYDYLIFDTAAGISQNVTFFCTAAQEIILIATPEPTSLTDVYALIKVLSQKHNRKHFRLVVNSVKTENEALQVFKNLSAVTDKFLSSVYIEYLGYIVTDPNVPKAVRRQRPVLEIYPYTKASRCIETLCHKIIQEKIPATGNPNQPFIWKDVFQMQ